MHADVLKWLRRRIVESFYQLIDFGLCSSGVSTKVLILRIIAASCTARWLFDVGELLYIMVFVLTL